MADLRFINSSSTSMLQLPAGTSSLLFRRGTPIAVANTIFGPVAIFDAPVTNHYVLPKSLCRLHTRAGCGPCDNCACFCNFFVSKISSITMNKKLHDKLSTCPRPLVIVNGSERLLLILVEDFVSLSVILRRRISFAGIIEQQCFQIIYLFSEYRMQPYINLSEFCN